MNKFCKTCKEILPIYAILAGKQTCSVRCEAKQPKGFDELFSKLKK